MATIQPKPRLSRLGKCRTTHDLPVAQRWLVRVMAENQFGRIENLRIVDGQPVPDRRLRIVRVARLGGARAEAPTPQERDGFELKRAIEDLLDELSRLGNGLVGRLEFRHGLPFQIEMTMHVHESAIELACPAVVQNNNLA